MLSGQAGGGNAYTGTKASYVALSAVSMLALSLLCSIWIADVSGAVALLGLFSIYMASQELLVLFMVFIPASILVDLFKFGGAHGASGRGWLIFLQLLELAAKVAGGFFSFSLYSSLGPSGDYDSPARGGYAAPPPPSIPIPGTQAAYQRVDPMGPPAYSPAPPHMPSVATMGHPVQQQQQQHLQQQQPQQQQPMGVPAAPVAPHHDLV